MSVFITAFSSCVWDENLDIPQNLEKKDTTELVHSYQSNSADNVLIVSGEEVTGVQMDWTTDWQDAVQDIILSDEKQEIYAYDGKNAVFTFTGDTPSLIYHQTNDWADSGFRYAVTNHNDYMSNAGQMQFKDAFGYVKFRIKNNEKALHLQVSDISLCQINTGGTFVFPSVNESAHWMTYNETGMLQTTADTLNIATNNIIEFPVVEETLPIIPQNKTAYKVDYAAWGDAGAYLLLNCRIYQMRNPKIGFQQENDMLLWSNGKGGFAKVLIPLDLKVEMGETVVVDVLLENGCPWYHISEGKAHKILQPIIFDAEVEDWQQDTEADVNIEV